VSVSEKLNDARLYGPPLPIHTGVIIEITDPTGGGHFGYIQDENGDRVLFHANDCIPSVIGTRHWPIGTSVSFNIAPENFKRKDIYTREAIRIRCIDAWNNQAYAHDHVEDSRIDVLNHGDHGLWGFLLRQNGERLHFSDAGRLFITTGAETLHVGSWVRHKVRSRKKLDNNNTLLFYAFDVEIYEEQVQEEQVHFAPDSVEAAWLAAAEAEPTPEPAPQPAPAKSAVLCLRPEHRKKSLRELARVIKPAAAVVVAS